MQLRPLLGLLVAACGGKPSAPPIEPSPPVTVAQADAAPSSSRCTSTPRAIATNQDAPGLVVVDATTAYWTNQNGGQVMSAPLDGGAPITLAENQHPFGITINAKHVYWANNVARTGSVMRVSKQGGKPEIVADTQDVPYAPVLTADALYWVNGDGTVMRAALDGKNRKVLATGQIGPTAIATDGKSVFWIHTKAGSEIRKVSIDGGTPVTLAVIPNGNPPALVLDRSRVLWTNPHRGTVESTSVDGGIITDVIVDEHAPIDLVVDDKNIYWVDHDRPDIRPAPPKRIRKAPLAGGDGVTLASGNDAVGITVDAQCVYWTEARGKTGAVMTVAK